MAMTQVDPPSSSAPGFTSGASAGTPENCSTTTVVYQATVGGGVGAATFSLVSDGAAPDSQHFNINSVTGAVTFAASPDFEVPDDAESSNIYHIKVAYSDGHGTIEQAVAITVTDVNEPPFFYRIGQLSIAENTTTIGSVGAFDYDADARLIYSITDGADKAALVIDANGVLSFKHAPDFERPSDANGDNVYDLTVQVSDGVLSAFQQVHVRVLDVK